MKRLVPFLLAAAVLANSSCHMFSSKKNPAAPKESKTVATDVEKDFMRRWIDKRARELGKGMEEGIVDQVGDHALCFVNDRS